MQTFRVSYWDSWKSWGQRHEGWMSYSSGTLAKVSDDVRRLGDRQHSRFQTIRVTCDGFDGAIIFSFQPGQGTYEERVIGDFPVTGLLPDS